MGLVTGRRQMHRAAPVRAGWARFVLAAAIYLGAAALASASDEPYLYVKKATWAETMLATRAAYREHLAQAAHRSPDTAAKPFVSDVILGEGPAQHISVSVAGQSRMRLAVTLEQGLGNCSIWGEAKLIARDGSETRVCDLNPLSVRVGWGQLLRNKNWKDEPLQIGERKLRHGLWVHTDSDVCYALDRKYERFEAWIGMDAARATGAARFRVLFGEADPIPTLWRRLAEEFPVQARWLEQDAGRGREAEWLSHGEDTDQDQALIGRALGSLGTLGEPLRRELLELRRASAPPADPRWLGLYARACRARDCLNAARQVWVIEVREGLEARVAALARSGAPADDPRWGDLQAAAERVAGALGQGRELRLADLGPALDTLPAALGAHWAGAADLRARVDACWQHWQQALPALAGGDTVAVTRLGALCDEVRSMRGEMLLGLRGMPEFLKAWASLDLPGEWQSQYETLQSDLRNRAYFARVAPETYRREALILDGDRDPADVLLRRTAALLADLKNTPGAPPSGTRIASAGPVRLPRRANGDGDEGAAGRSRLAGLADELDALRAASERIPVTDAEARYLLFAQACRLRRDVALCNPLLAFDRLLFTKRHRAIYEHMCDQFYGMAARPGGGLFTLDHPFTPNATLKDVLADSVVVNGRLKGQRLSGGPARWWNLSFDGMGNLHGEESEGGSFLSPDLSYDGKSILFAYVECRGDRNHRHHTDPTQGHWAEGRCYHLFRVNVDGSGLTQLTDGTWNDFDPCYLPNGRVAFISERRGGYLRCGRVCPNYNLYDMAADGSDLNCLSFHETNEWQPSVTHDGKIIYTRWDYVDRHGCTAHLPWVTTPDGRDSRAVHGNFAPRSSRPDMELNVRAIPGSRKFVATAAPHHGQAFGSLVLVDPDVEDDDGMAPVKRITPEVGFPESQGGAEAYGTAWPLSEEYYLCVYDAGMALRRPGTRGDYGIYLVDAFGNKELIYRDPQIGCLSPIPLRPRPCPPAVPDASRRDALRTNPATRALARNGNAPEATIAVVNVYDSLKPWPEGTKIKALRVLQLLPMTVPSGAPPHETGVRIATAGDSVVPARSVLGTVPVEEDGSAYLRVPANKELFFQAVDERGMAVQSMRSATYLHEGEHLTCQGCHDNRYRAPRAAARQPLATRRAPSVLTADVDGSNPFSYPRLVQPVLDRHCVSCHAQNHNTAPNLAREPIQQHWYASYVSLVPRYAFTSYGSGYVTTPGRFGARASKLTEILAKGHHGVKLSAEEWHRLTLWLDCSSMFYGVYEKEGGEAQLRGEVVRPTLE